MRVKSLQLLGFKSFATKTTIHFEPGVTAIVGPNGSGKSNCVDGIRWVLGEHNPRDVRAPRLEDVIFNGTDQKAPLSMAEVSLTIENEDGQLPISFNEITLTRRVYRSGESECFINQSPCRLRDIQELFRGTGLGGGTYAIIEQGHIDMVLSSKPEERRVVFEEASGIAKYLAKRQETSRRLDEVEEHLVRIADVIGEVRRQVNALERQAAKARQYKTQWERLKALELQLAADELRGGRSRDATLERELATLQAQRVEREAEKQRWVETVEASNAAVSSVQQALQALRTRLVEARSDGEQHANQRTLKAGWIDELRQQAEQASREATQLRGRIAQCEEQLTRLWGGEHELNQQAASLRERLAALEAETQTLDAQWRDATATLEAGKGELFTAATEASAARNELTVLSSRLHAADARLNRCEQQRTQLDAQLETLATRHTALAREQGTLQQQHEELTRRLRETQGAFDVAVARRHEQTGRLHQLREQTAAQRAQVQLCEDAWRRYEGFPDALQTLMSQPIDGLIGPLADLIQPAAGQETLVEAALGPLAEAVVVRDRQALAQCRRLLAGHQLPGCRFLVLEDCPNGQTVLQESPGLPGLSKAVRDVVQVEPAYRRFVEWLLNDSWIIDDLQRVFEARQTPQCRLVSQQGDRWDRRSWRFAGDGGREPQRLGRKQRWERASNSLSAVEAELAERERSASEAEQEWQRLLQTLESAKGQAAQVAPALQRLTHQLSQLTQESGRHEASRREVELEAADVTAQQDALRAQLAAAEQTVEGAQQRQQQVEQQRQAAQADRDAAQAKRQELLVAKAQVDASLQSLGERRQALQERGRELDADRERFTQEAATRTIQQDDARRRIEELTQQLSAHEEASRQRADECQRVEQEAVQQEARLREAQEQRDQVVPRLLAVEQQLSQVAQQIQERTQRMAEQTFRRERVIERLRELYQIDDATLQAAQQAEAEPLADAQRAELVEQTKGLRAKLEGVGPVSLGSVEEYDELKRRLEFLQGQQQDLIQARDDLKTSITQINRTARTQFRETFERLRQEFQHYFGRLFDGGQSDLILMDEEDVLTSGIDIVARPPGKRLQSISLLSGGERALTAIALLFALFKVRPSPFCVLDEIDAPLDEANVDRFTRVLEEFLALSQFILITHNKKTITKADSLYGVTMEEAGISKILSAKLTETARPTAPAASPVPA